MTKYPANDRESHLNSDETMAERLATLALLFMNTHHPVDSKYILKTLYIQGEDPSKKEVETAKKTFDRDRKRLASCGIHIISVALSDGANAYQVDERSSFVDSQTLSTRDAFILDMVCQPLLNDPSFPYAEDLRLALAKIDRSFQSSSTLSPQRLFKDSAPQSTFSKAAATVRSSYMSLHACHIVYTDTNGITSERDIAPFGLFGLRNSIYVVAAAVENNQINSEKMRTFNIERIRSAQELPSLSFQIPVDFDLQDYIRLPFQIGHINCKGTFLVPDKFESDLRQIVGKAGVFYRTEQGLFLKVPISCEKSAAQWGIAWSLIPVEPASFVCIWQEMIERSCNG